MFKWVHVRHDDQLFERIFEKPLGEKIELKMNDMEKQYGKVKAVSVLQHVDNQYAELLVEFEDEV